MSKEQTQKGPSFDDILQMLKKSFIDETKELREELMDWKVKCKELEKQNNILDYRIKGSNNRISELEKKMEETEELKNSTMRKYYDLKKDYDELNQFKTSITHMVSPSKDNTSSKSSTISSISTNLSSKFASPELRKNSSLLSDFNEIESNLYTPIHSSSKDRDFDPIMTTSQQRNKYGSDSPIIFHNKTTQKNREIRSRSATLSTRKKTSILKDPSSYGAREKNVKFSPSTKGPEDERNSADTSFSAPPTPHSSFGIQYSKLSDLKEESDKVSDRFVSTPSRRTFSNQEHTSTTNRVSRMSNITTINNIEEIGDVSAQELYLKVKKALSLEEFKNFSTNIRKLNMGEQSITTTLVNLREIIGEERQNLYSHLKRVISAGEM